MTQSLLSVGIFLAVLACIPWLLKKAKERNLIGVGELGPQAKIVSAVAVGPHQRVVLLEIGPEGARTLLTLGVTQQSISCLHTASVPSNGGGTPASLEEKA